MTSDAVVNEVQLVGLELLQYDCLPDELRNRCLSLEECLGIALSGFSARHLEPVDVVQPSKLLRPPVQDLEDLLEMLWVLEVEGLGLVDNEELEAREKVKVVRFVLLIRATAQSRQLAKGQRARNDDV